MNTNKVLIFSDLHVHPHKKDFRRVEDCLKVVDWVFETASQKNIDNILFGGDLFHDRKLIDIPTYQACFERFLKNLSKTNCNLFLLLGNHDIWFNENSSITSVYPFSVLPRTKVISNPERIKIANHFWDFIPFTHDPISTLKSLDNLSGKKEFALGHIAINNAVLHGKTYSEDISIEYDGDMIKIDACIFSQYKKTFLGHYHLAQQLDYNVEYIGSPLEFNFGECGDKKHIIVFDCDAVECQYVSNDFSPKHQRKYIKSADEFIKSKKEINGFVKLFYDSKEITAVDAIKIRKEIESQSNGVLTFELIPQKVQIDEHVISDASSILKQGNLVIANYVDQVGTKGLDRETLITIGEELCKSIL